MALVYGMGLETPVGPPWMTTSSGYLRAASKSAGLCSTPSTVVPSWLFHEITSRVLPIQPAVCAFMSVNLRAEGSATYTSGIDFGSARRKAAIEPSLESEKPESTTCSLGVIRSIFLFAGSRRYRYDHVRCD